MKSNPIVSIAGTVGGVSVAIVALFCVFAKDLWPAAPAIIGVLAAMGIILGFFARKRVWDSQPSRRED